MKNGTSMNQEELEQHYRDITSLYDMAEDLASTVESEFVTNPEAQLALVEPLINHIADATDQLAAEYISILENPARKKSAKSRIEGALRKIFMAIEEYRSQLSAQSNKTLAALANIADPVVDKIRKQAQKITVIFMQFLELSLERIMHKYEIEEFKRSNDRAVASLQLGH
jgi:hypothetical protein